MTKSTLFDRLNQELEAFGKKAQAALDEGKLQIELLRLRRKQDSAARDLGLLIHRRERGGRSSRAGSTRCCCGWTIWRRRSAGWRRRSPRPSSSGPRRLASPCAAPSTEAPQALIARSGPRDFRDPGRDGHPDPVRVIAAEPVHAQAGHPLQVADLVHGPRDDARSRHRAPG